MKGMGFSASVSLGGGCLVDVLRSQAIPAVARDPMYECDVDLNEGALLAGAGSGREIQTREMKCWDQTPNGGGGRSDLPRPLS